MILDFGHHYIRMLYGITVVLSWLFAKKKEK